MVTHSPKILAIEEKVTLNLKVMFLSSKSRVDAPVYNTIIRLSS